MHSFMDLFKVSSSPDKKEEPTKEEEEEEECYQESVWFSKICCKTEFVSQLLF